MARQGTFQSSQAIVRQHDRDRFLVGLASPGRRHVALWPLFAFNYEISKTREVVSEPRMGMIRLQWWRDAVAGIYEGGDVPAHEIITELQQTIRDFSLPRMAFDALIDARARDLDNTPMENLEMLENYAESTTAPLNRLVLNVLGEQGGEAQIGVVSRAYALTGLLRAVPFHTGQGRCLLPADMMQTYGVTRDNLPRSGREALKKLARTLAVKVQAGLPPDKELSGFLKSSAALTRLYLRRIERLEGDLFDARLSHPPAGFLLRLFFGFR